MRSILCLRQKLDEWPIFGSENRQMKTLKSWIERDLYKNVYSWFGSFDKPARSKSHTTHESIRSIYQIEKSPQLVQKVLQQFTNVDRIVSSKWKYLVKSYYYYKEFLFAYRLGMYFSSRRCILCPGAERSVILWCWLYIYIYVYRL